MKSDDDPFQKLINNLVADAKSGDAEAMLLLSRLLFLTGDPTAGLRWLKEAAIEDLAEAQRDFGIYLHFRVRNEADHYDAMGWLGAAAEQGESRAQALLSHVLLRDDRRNARA
jgi:TPR repeat protein